MRAMLIGTAFIQADLSGADLSVANLSIAFLRHADLRETQLFLTNFCSADFTGTNLESAHFNSTILSDIDLSTAKGLHSCNHNGRSLVDQQTLIQPGTLPLTFLRGVGLPDILIEYLPSLLNQAIQFYSCFISYSSKNQSFAERLYSDLQNKGVRCWFAPEDLKIGDKIRGNCSECRIVCCQ